MDENSMSGCPCWGWFNRLEEARCNVYMTNSDDNRTITYHNDLLKFNSGIFQRRGNVSQLYIPLVIIINFLLLE